MCANILCNFALCWSMFDPFLMWIVGLSAKWLTITMDDQQLATGKVGRDQAPQTLGRHLRVDQSWGSMAPLRSLDTILNHYWYYALIIFDNDIIGHLNTAVIIKNWDIKLHENLNTKHFCHGGQKLVKGTPMRCTQSEKCSTCAQHIPHWHHVLPRQGGKRKHEKKSKTGSRKTIFTN